MVIPRDTFESKEEMDAFLDGHPLPRKPKVVRPEPTPPQVENQIYFKDISDGEVEDAVAKISVRKNAEGMRLCGYNFMAKFRSGKVVEGWITEFDLEKFKKIIPESRSDIRAKLSW
jgi:hypothetical protein